MLSSEIPAVPSMDSVMVSGAESLCWAEAAFCGGCAPSSAQFLGLDVPFSFIYDGRCSSEFLHTWVRSVETEDSADYVQHTVSWTDPATGLSVTAVVKAFKDYPAVDWIVYFENEGSADTPVIESIQALDVRTKTDDRAKAAVLHRLHGDNCDRDCFQPFDTYLACGRSISMAPFGGRSSSVSAFPFFNFEFEGQGIITAIGWTGQWAASFDREAEVPTRIRAGMELTHLKLHPGEKIRTPRIVTLTWQGDRIAAHNRFRRLLLFHYVPKLEGRPTRLPLASQCFDRYSWSVPEWSAEAGQIDAVQTTHELGCDSHWLDASWFIGGFPYGVGNWTHKPAEFPNGLKRVSDECHRLGLKFILWFEPERVTRGSEIAEEHPDYMLWMSNISYYDGKEIGLFKLNDQGAREWLTDLLSSRITEYGIDVYRNDFNMDPLPFWRGNDELDRQGMTEIRYIEGLYRMWDDLRERHPGLWIDNCASGGRRIDIEMCSRSVPLWRSDTSCSTGHVDWNQVQSCGLGLYIPLHTACGWTPDAYTFRSSATGGAICQFDYRTDGFPVDEARAAIAEAKENQKYWYGDFYPMADWSIDPGLFPAYQFHRPDLNEGLVLAFRRPACEFASVSLCLKAVDPEARYDLEFVDEERRSTRRAMSGSDLIAGLQLNIPGKGQSLIVRYKQEQRQ